MVIDDGILIKSNHGVILMIEKDENHIINSAEDKVLTIKKMIDTDLTGTPDGGIISICFWIT